MLYVTETVGRGRGLFVEDSWSAGIAIGDFEPYVWIVSEGKLSSICANCATCADDIKRCSLCKRVYYCSAKCQSLDWKTFHRLECRALCHFGDELPSDLLRIGARCIWRRNQERAVKESNSILTDFNHLFSNYENVSEKLKCEIASTIMSLQLYMNVELAAYFESPRELIEFMLRITVNGIEITNEELQTIGFAIFLTPSLINHSCKPNCFFNFRRNGILSIRVLEDIEADEELTVSYVDLLSPKAERQEQFTSQYFFICNCIVCSDSSVDRRMLSRYCTNCKDGICEFESDCLRSCNNCDGNGNIEFNCLSRISRIQENDNAEIRLKKLRELREKALLLLPVDHLHWYTLYQQLAEESLLLKDYTNQLVYERNLLEILCSYLQKSHPLIAIQSARITKLLAYLGDFHEAINQSDKTISLAKVCFGVTCDLVNDMKMTKYNCERERKTPKNLLRK